MRITPGRFTVLQTTYLEVNPDDGTKLKVYYQLQDPRYRWMARPYCKFVAGFLGFELKRLKRLLTY
jgi:hypothetical protein